MLTSICITETFALPDCVWDEDKKSKNMVGIRNSAEKRSPSHHDGLVNPSNGLSIKGAAARRRQALERASAKETAGTATDQGSALLETSMESTPLPVSKNSRGKVKEITNGVSDADAPTAVNNPSVNAEIASVGQHLTTTGPSLHNYPDETGAQSGISRTSTSDMPPLQSAGFSRTNGQGKSLLHHPLHRCPTPRVAVSDVAITLSVRC